MALPSVLSAESQGADNIDTSTETAYLLPHHAKELERLRQQHAFILSSTGNVLVTAPLEQRKIRVLDCGAADGTWLLDLPRLYPEHEWSLHGIDIGSALFPPKTGPYTALDLREFDMRSATPPDPSWTASFDLIHQRLLIWGLSAVDWTKVLSNHAALLKPGGWIQLVEIQWEDPEHPFDPTETPYLAKIDDLQTWTSAKFGFDRFIAHHLDDLLREAGFEHVQKRQLELGYGAAARDPTWRKRSVDMWMEVFRGIKDKLGEDGIPGFARTAEELDEYLDGLRAELLEKGFRPKISYVIGQKPGLAN